MDGLEKVSSVVQKLGGKLPKFVVHMLRLQVIMVNLQNVHLPEHRHFSKRVRWNTGE